MCAFVCGCVRVGVCVGWGFPTDLLLLYRQSGSSHITVLTLPSAGSHHSRTRIHPSIITKPPPLSLSHTHKHTHTHTNLPIAVSPLFDAKFIFVSSLLSHFSVHRNIVWLACPFTSPLLRERKMWKQRWRRQRGHNCYRKISMVFERDFNWGICYIWKGELLRGWRERSCDPIHILRHS